MDRGTHSNYKWASGEGKTKSTNRMHATCTGTLNNNNNNNNLTASGLSPGGSGYNAYT
jgi:hypothetical protein